MTEFINKKHLARTAVFVHSDNTTKNKHVAQAPKISKKFDVHPTKSSRRNALDDVSNKVVSSDIIHLKNSVKKSAEANFGCEMKPPVVRPGLRLEEDVTDNLPIETMPTSDFQLEDDYSDIWPLHLRITIDEVDRLMGRKVEASQSPDLDCIPPDDDVYLDDDYFLNFSMPDLPEYLDNSLCKPTLEDNQISYIAPCENLSDIDM